MWVKKDGKVLEEKPFFRVSEIVIPSRGVMVSAAAIFEAVNRGIRLSFLGPTGTPYAMLSTPMDVVAGPAPTEAPGRLVSDPRL